jgi:nucleotide-binding universal stress UspA family protein
MFAGKLNSVLVPVDFSEQSFAAVDSALEIAKEPAGVFVLHVLPDLSAAAPGMVWEAVDPPSRFRHAREALQKRLGDARYHDVQLNVVIGDPGHEIVDEAKRVAADLIIMPSHGRRGLSRLLLGSVAERVLRLAETNVLIPKQKAK